jgi:sugar-specific transcriptional regulator TrmB
MKELEKSLTKVGFSSKKAQIYLALLELGEATVIDIAKKTTLKRTTVYNIIPELIQEGLVKTAIRQKHRIFYIENPNSLKYEVEERLLTIDRILPELRAVHNIIPNKPRITFYEGVGGMKELYADTLDSLQAGDTIMSYQGFNNFYTWMSKDYMDSYVADRVRRKIRIKMIVPDAPTARIVQKEAVQNLREVKIIEGGSFQFTADTEIYANKVALISYTENFMGVIIESKEINQMQRMAFEVMWRSL